MLGAIFLLIVWLAALGVGRTVYSAGHKAQMSVPLVRALERLSVYWYLHSRAVRRRHYRGALFSAGQHDRGPGDQFHRDRLCLQRRLPELPGRTSAVVDPAI